MVTEDARERLGPGRTVAPNQGAHDNGPGCRVQLLVTFIFESKNIRRKLNSILLSYCIFNFYIFNFSISI